MEIPTLETLSQNSLGIPFLGLSLVQGQLQLPPPPLLPFSHLSCHPSLVEQLSLLLMLMLPNTWLF
jgi:hypothetical protein